MCQQNGHQPEFFVPTSEGERQYVQRLEEPPVPVNQVQFLLRTLEDRQVVELRLAYEPASLDRADWGLEDLIPLGEFSLSPEAAADLVAQVISVDGELCTQAMVEEAWSLTEAALEGIEHLVSDEDQDLTKEELIRDILLIIESRRGICPACQAEAEEAEHLARLEDAF